MLACVFPLLAQTTTRAATITTGKVTADVSTVGNRLGSVTVHDLASGRSAILPEAFVLTMQDGTVIPASRLRVEKPLAEEPSSAGKRVCTELTSATPQANLHWCLLAREGAGYVRQQLTIQATGKDLPISEVRLLDFTDPDAHVAGTVKGLPSSIA